MEAVRFLLAVAGGGFLVYAAVATLRGTVYDVEDGRVDRTTRPVTFWLLIVSMSALGLAMLGVAFDWPIAGSIGRALSLR